MASNRDVTQVLREVAAGAPEATEQLLPLVYDELKLLARSYFKAERPGHTLQATAIVHEAYLRLVGGASVDWKDRTHFFAVAARAMRRVLIDHARTKSRAKRGGDWERVPLDNISVGSGGATLTDLIALNDGLEKLSNEVPDVARIVELKFFGGLTNDEVAEVLGKSHATIERYWKFGRARLYRMMRVDTATESTDKSP